MGHGIKRGDAIALDVIDIRDDLEDMTNAYATCRVPIYDVADGFLPDFDSPVMVFNAVRSGGKWMPAWRHPEGPRGNPWVWCTEIDMERGSPAPRIPKHYITHWSPMLPNPE